MRQQSNIIVVSGVSSGCLPGATRSAGLLCVVCRVNSNYYRGNTVKYYVIIRKYYREKLSEFLEKIVRIPLIKSVYTTTIFEDMLLYDNEA